MILAEFDLTYIEQLILVLQIITLCIYWTKDWTSANWWWSIAFDKENACKLLLIVTSRRNCFYRFKSLNVFFLSDQKALYALNAMQTMCEL